MSGAVCLVGEESPLRAELGRRLEQAGWAVAALPPARTRAEADANVGEARDRHGTIGALVSCPPTLAAASLDELDPEAFDGALDAAYKSPFRYTQVALADLREVGTGRIVYVTSSAGMLGRAYTAHLAAGARATIALMRTVAVEESPAVTANAVAVGAFDGDPLLGARVRSLLDAGQPDPATAERVLAAELPLGRLVDPADVAETVVWALRPQSAFLTGQTIAVASGGELQVWP